MQEMGQNTSNFNSTQLKLISIKVRVWGVAEEYWQKWKWIMNICALMTELSVSLRHPQWSSV